MLRLQRILDRADELGMVVILGFFYFGQEQRLRDEQAIVRAVDEAIDWLFDHDYHNVLIEIANESGRGYQQPTLQPDRIHELVLHVKERVRNGRRFSVSTSCGCDLPGQLLPTAEIVAEADFVLLHGNNVSGPTQLRELVRAARQIRGYRPMPVLFNEDDHFDFHKPLNHMTAAIEEYAGWGYFDYRLPGESVEHGYQSMPIDWGISSERKRAFFGKVAEITNSDV